MKRTSIMLPEDIKTRAEERARQMGISLGEFIRESLEAFLAERKDKRTPDPLFSDSAVSARRAPRNLAARHDEHLYGRGT